MREIAIVMAAGLGCSADEARKLLKEQKKPQSAQTAVMSGTRIPARKGTEGIVPISTFIEPARIRPHDII